jgi:hypothetical protein
MVDFIRQPDELMGYYYNTGGNFNITLNIYKVVRTSSTKYGHYNSKPAYKAYSVLRYKFDLVHGDHHLERIPTLRGMPNAENLSLGNKSEKAREGQKFFTFSGTTLKVYNLNAPMSEAMNYGVVPLNPNQLNQINEDIKKYVD